MTETQHTRTVRRFALHVAALVIVAAGAVLTGHVTWHDSSCTYGGASVANGAAVTSSVHGVDALCDNGTMVAYVPR